MKKRALTRVIPAALIAAMLVLVSACASDPAPTQSTPAGEAAADTPVAGGNYVHALEADPLGCLDGAQQRYHVAFNIIRQTVDSLVDLDPKTGEIVPWLAEEWDINDKATEFTFKLKDGVTFSNGEKLDAETIKANFDRIAKLGPTAIGAGPVITGYKDTEIIDPLTAKIVFEKPTIQFLEGLTAAWLGIISKSDTEKTPEQLCSGDYSGTGPFVLDHYTQNEEAVLKKRVGYTSPSTLYDHKGDAYVDTLTFKFLSESAVRTGAAQTGEVHSISEVPFQDEAAVTASGANLLSAQIPGFETSIIANQQSTFGGDAAVRKAIGLAINREELLTVVGSGWETGTALYGPKTAPYYVDQSALLKYDLEEAKKVLDEAGWKEGADGIREKGGKKLSITFISSLPYWDELLQQQFKAVGIDYPIQKLDTAASADVLAKGEYDFLSWNMTRADPDVLRQIFQSGLGGKGQNRSWALPSEADAYWDAQAADVDPVKRVEDLKKALDYTVENDFGIPLLDRAWTYAYGPTVHGFKLDGETKLVFFDVWIEQK